MRGPGSARGPVALVEPGATGPGPLDRKRLLIVVTVALALRLIHVLAVRDSLLFHVLVGDAALFDRWGARMAAGHWVGDDVYFMAPLYPYFLGALYTVFGHHVIVARIAQIVLGALACGLVAGGTARLTTRRTGLVAGLLLAAYAPAIWLEVLIQKTALATFLTAAFFAATARFWSRRRTSDAAWAGFALGLLALTRENAGVLLLALLPWLLYGPLQEPRRTRLRWIGAALLAFALPLLPVVARNVAVAGTPLTTYNFGVNFWIGNHAGADGLYQSVRPGRGWPEAERTDSRELAEAEEGRKLTSMEVSRFWLDRGLAWIRAEPAAWAALTMHKLRLVWHGQEQMDSESFESYRDASPPLDLMAVLLNFGVLVPLAALGALFARRVWRDQAWIGASLALVTLSVALFFVFARFRFTLVPFLIPLAAAGLIGFADRWQSGERRSFAPAAMLLVLVTAAVNWPLAPAGDPRAQTEVNLGGALLREGHADEAARVLASAYARESGNPAAAYNLGIAQRVRGKYAEARAALAGALLLAPAWEPEILAELGVLAAEEGNPEQALTAFDRALELDPLQPDALYRRGLTLRRLGREAEAERDYERALELRPTHADAHHNLGFLLAKRGEQARAEQHFRAALRAQPEHAFAAQELAWLLVRDESAAPEAIEEALTLVTRAGDLQQWSTPEVWETLAQVRAVAGDRSGARDAATRALELAEAQGRSSYAVTLRERLERLR